MSARKKKVFAATSGSYSDYRVVALFATQSRADNFAAHLDEGDTAELFLFESGQPQKVLVHTAYWSNESGHDVHCSSRMEWDIDSHAGKRPLVTVVPGDAPIAQRGGFWVRAEGLDAKACIKAVADRKAKYLAEQAGVA